MIYEIATLACRPEAARNLFASVGEWAAQPENRTNLLGLWRTEAGVLGRLLILRSFATAKAMATERMRTLADPNPFQAGGTLTEMSLESYAPFSFLPPVFPKAHGNLYEFRTYQLAPGKLPDVMANWETGMKPAADYTQRMVINMYALDGPQRITHIWGFASFEERMAIRSNAAEAGVWPPPGVAPHMLDATSILAIPYTASPLR